MFKFGSTLAIVRDTMLILLMLGAVVFAVRVAQAMGSDAVPAPVATTPPLPVDKCGGGICR